MTRIEIWGRVLWSDGARWIVGRRVEQKDKGTGERELVDRAESFYGRLPHALSAMVDDALKESDAESLGELKEELFRIRAELGALFAAPEVGT